MKARSSHSLKLLNYYHFETPLSTTTMKSPSQTQSTSTHPTNLTSSILQALPTSNVDSSAFPITPKNTSVQERRRLRARILESAIALIDSDDFDSIESFTTHQ
jgi:hypothetical protein